MIQFDNPTPIGDSDSILSGDKANYQYTGETLRDAILGLQRKPVEIANFSRAGLLTLNPNPIFGLKGSIEGSGDYESWIQSSKGSIVYDVVNNTPASLQWKDGTSSLISDTFYAIDPEREYRASLSVKTVVSGANYDPAKEYRQLNYLGVACYDSDFQIIFPQHITTVAGSTPTTLVSPLNPGDTTIHLADATGWYNDGLAHKRAIRFHKLRPDGTYGYIGNNGRYYDAEDGYTRDMLDRIWDAGGISQNGDNTWTITLKTPYAGNTIPAGTKARNSQGGGVYNYWISGLSTLINNQWSSYSSPWNLPDTSDPNAFNGVIRNGTAYVKLLLLPNYNIYENGTNIGHNPPGILRTSWYSKLALEYQHIPPPVQL